MKHYSNTIVDRELHGFDSMVEVVGGSSPRKQSRINLLIFGGVVIAFTVGLFFIDEDWVGKVALEVAILLISVKLGFYLHNSVKFNHYTFWMFAAFENRLLSIIKEQTAQRKLLEKILDKKIDEEQQETNDKS